MKTHNPLYLSFISNEHFKETVKQVLKAGEKARQKAEREFGKNVIDPFAMMWEMAAFDLEPRQWRKNERARQMQKSLANNIGLFHQKLLAGVAGWREAEDVIDLVNDDKKIIAEVKNKHNTVKASDKIGIYKNLRNMVTSKGHEYRDYTAYFVQVIPKQAGKLDEPFAPSDNTSTEKTPANKLIREIDGASFYALATGEKDALEKVFKALPYVIKECCPGFNPDKALDYATEFFDKAYKKDN